MLGAHNTSNLTSSGFQSKLLNQRCKFPGHFSIFSFSEACFGALMAKHGHSGNLSVSVWSPRKRQPSRIASVKSQSFIPPFLSNAGAHVPKSQPVKMPRNVHCSIHALHHLTFLILALASMLHFSILHSAIVKALASVLSLNTHPDSTSPEPNIVASFLLMSIVSPEIIRLLRCNVTLISFHSESDHSEYLISHALGMAIDVGDRAG